MSKGKWLRNSNGLLKWGLILLIVFSCLTSSTQCRSEDAAVLPKGRWMTNIKAKFYPVWNKEYNDQSREEDLAEDYNRDLDDKVIPDLAAFETSATKTALGLPADYEASLGYSIVTMDKECVITDFLVSYGLTDNLSLGFKIPYWTFKTTVKTKLSQDPATVVKNPAFDSSKPVGANNSSLVPEPVLASALAAKGLSQAQIDTQINSLKLTREDILNLLGDGISELKLSGFGYKKFDTWNSSGIGDLELGLKYRYLQNDHWRLALRGGMRLPTGEEDDPDNLVDYGFGGGDYDLSIGSHNDYIGFKNVVLSGSIRFIAQLPRKTTLRIPESVDQPLTTKKERVDLDRGDAVELELSAKYSLPWGFSLSVTTEAYYKSSDSVEGPSGSIASLEDETSVNGYTYLIGASYNNLSQVKQKRALVPFQIGLGYWNRFEGKNINKASYYALQGSLFF